MDSCMYAWHYSKMAPSSLASLFFFCLLLLFLPAQHGASSHASYKVGSRQVSFKTPGRSQQASRVPTATTCSSISTAGLGSNKLAVVHRQSPCSPLHSRLPSLTSAEVLRRDTSLLRRHRFSSRSSSSSSTVASPSSLSSAAPSPAPSSSISIPVNGSSDLSTPPGALDYSVLVGYGTPEQQLPVLLDTSATPSVLWCKPCPSGGGSDDCDPAFDTSRSSTFAHVPCGSPECPANCSGAVCPLLLPPSTRVFGRFSTDLLTLAPSSTAAVPGFRFACLDLPERNADLLPEVGSLDLSRDGNSLPSRLSPSPASSPATFSYCLPPSTSPGSLGFLSLGAGVRDAAEAHAPLVSNHGVLANMYFIDLVGMSLGGEDLPILASSFGANGTNLDVSTTFALLPPAAYAPLREAFRVDMKKYNPGGSPLPGHHAGFDTCYNFTGLNLLVVPLLELKFGNGDTLLINQDQMLYYDDPDAAPFTVACLAFSGVDDDDDAFGVIGSYTLASTEVVYDVVGGKVGFTPRSC